jgi:hypothetical protein
MEYSFYPTVIFCIGQADCKTFRPLKRQTGSKRSNGIRKHQKASTLKNIIYAEQNRQAVIKAACLLNAILKLIYRHGLIIDRDTNISDIIDYRIAIGYR